MTRLAAMIEAITPETWGGRFLVMPDGADGWGRPTVNLTVGEPDALNSLLQKPLVYLFTDALGFYWRDVQRKALLGTLPVTALVYYPRDDADSALESGDFVWRLAAELTAPERWYGAIPGVIEAPDADYLGFDQSTNAHQWALYFEYRRLPVPPHQPFAGPVPLEEVVVTVKSDLTDRNPDPDPPVWRFHIAQEAG